MRRILSVVVLFLVAVPLAACGETGESSTASTSSTAVEAAPDFTLALADGGVYRLADERKPLYMVFWAEW